MLATLQAPEAEVTVRQLSKLIDNLMSSIEAAEAARIMVAGLPALRAVLTKDGDWDWGRAVPISMVSAEILF